VGKQSFPASHTKHDEFFGDVDIFRDHLEIEIPLQRQEPALNTLILEVAFQGCADVGVCYMPLKKTGAFDLPAESTNKKGVTPAIDQPAPFVSEQDRIAAALKTGSVWLIVLSFLGFGFCRGNILWLHCSRR
jgi:thiol:disulfide interchange protein DsbD